MKYYGIMGGTFNPIHLGHLMISEYIRDEIKLDKIIFVPTGNPPHKSDLLDAEIRYEMTKMAIEDNENFMISDIETKRQGVSYTVDTVNQLSEELDAKLSFIIGSDTLFQLKTWKRFDELAKQIEFICAIRPEYMATKILSSELIYLNQKFDARIKIIKTPQYMISSTDLRNRIKYGKSLKYLLPDKLIEYIYERRLYIWWLKKIEKKS